MSRPAVPSRARVDCFGVGGAGVGEKLAVDGVGDASLEAAHGFHGGLAGGELAPVVGPAGRVVPQLHERGDVKDVVHPAVPGPGEPVADLLS